MNSETAGFVDAIALNSGEYDEDRVGGGEDDIVVVAGKYFLVGEDGSCANPQEAVNQTAALRCTMPNSTHTLLQSGYSIIGIDAVGYSNEQCVTLHIPAHNGDLTLEPKTRTKLKDAVVLRSMPISGESARRGAATLKGYATIAMEEAEKNVNDRVDGNPVINVEKTKHLITQLYAIDKAVAGEISFGHCSVGVGKPTPRIIVTPNVRKVLSTLAGSEAAPIKVENGVTDLDYVCDMYPSYDGFDKKTPVEVDVDIIFQKPK